MAEIAVQKSPGWISPADAPSQHTLHPTIEVRIPMHKKTKPRRPSYDDNSSDEYATANSEKPPLEHGDVDSEGRTPGGESHENVSVKHASRSRSNSPHAEPTSREDGDTPWYPSPPPQPTISYKQELILRGHRKGVSCVKVSPDSNWIASSGADCTIKIWDFESGELAHSMEGHLAGISTIAWGPDSETLASGSDDKTIRLWDTKLGKAYPDPFIGHHNYIYSIDVSCKGNMIVSGSYDEAVFIWDVRSASVMRSLPAHSDPVSSVQFCNDGTLIISSGHDSKIRIWDVATGQCLRTLVHEDNSPVSSAQFSPNSKYILAWTLDSCVRLWDYVEGRCLKTYQGHQNEMYSLSGAFGSHNNDAFVASGSEDGRIVLWDVKSKSILQELRGHEGVVLGLDFKSKTIVTCGLDKTVRIWRESL